MAGSGPGVFTKKIGSFIFVPEKLFVQNEQAYSYIHKAHKLIMTQTQQTISDHQAFLDFFQVMGERGAVSEILMEANLSPEDATPADDTTNYSYWNIAPLEVTAEAEAAIIASRGGIQSIREFMAWNAEWPEYQAEVGEETF